MLITSRILLCSLHNLHARNIEAAASLLNSCLWSSEILILRSEEELDVGYEFEFEFPWGVMCLTRL